MFLILCLALVFTGCKKKQERTPDILEMEDLRGSQPDAENPDTDGDGITDEDEKRIGTEPEKADSDGDGIPDGLELQLGLNPLRKSRMERLRIIRESLNRNTQQRRLSLM